ncbi:MAG: agmatine deiminase [Parvibaculum sp.]|uniref:agmatine deiminase n=1 Tax=Parvibaculum sp. TaxID=2024848 RepID=UPI00272F1202|nr:agmatine deiminase [Parvibaculum sp.]MDP1627718.1 agmatine deiminase [Parvibaculum sp.]MDP2150716.1 agmatine deiminase [Parvibaculum sp.]
MVRLLDTTPKADGFRMPAEFEPHAGTWMLWPERPDNWRLGAKPAQHAFVAVAEAISRGEPVTVGASPRQFANARAMLPPHIRVVEISNDDSWMRDCGPTFVVDGAGGVRAVDWIFNAWGGLGGGLYFPWDQDDLVASKVAEIERVDRYRAPIVLEGGSIHVDGEGTLLTTEECLLNPNRNPGLSRAGIEVTLAEYLNLEKIVWLGLGVVNDETSGHIDNLCCFVRPGVVALTWTDDKADPQYDISRDAFERLSAATDARGRRFEIHKLHQPGPLYITEEESGGVDAVEGTQPRLAGARLAASYVNFYIANGVLAVPVFGDPHDGEAIDKIAALFPGRTVMPVPAREILLGGGNIHCITQQQPAPRGMRS